jgi:hypothetical protein
VNTTRKAEKKKRFKWLKRMCVVKIGKNGRMRRPAKKSGEQEL